MASTGHPEPRPTGDAFALAASAAGWPLGRFQALDALPGAAHGVTTRAGPAFGRRADGPRAARAAQELASAAGLRGVAWCRQVHGATVLRADRHGLAGEADALVTAAPGLGVLGRSADCPLVLAAMPGAAGMAHASWRSTIAGITARMIQRLVRLGDGDAGAVFAGICPSAGPCCYEVGPEVRSAAISGLGPEAGDCFETRDGRLYFDLWRANAAQLARAGVPAANIHVAGICTICRNDLFPSHRREGSAAGRFGAVIGWRGGA